MHRTPLEAVHRAAGARLPSGGASALPLTYGDVPAEYRAGLESCLLLDDSERGALRVRGADATDFLHRLLANRIKGLEPGTGARNLLLSPKGKVEHLFDLLVGEGHYDLTTPAGTSAALAAALDRYLFGERVEIEDRTEELAPLALVGPRADEIVRAVVGDAPTLERGHARTANFRGAAVLLTRVGVAGSLGWRLDGGPEHAAALWSACLDAGARAGGRVAADSLRVEAGQAEALVDVDDNVYPQEARLEDAFSLDKGCYIGQEVVAKIDTYGGLNKRLVALAIDHDDPLPRGTRLVGRDAVTGDERELGVVTSWAYGFARDGGLALGYVKRRHQKVGTRFTLRAPDGSPLAGNAEVAPLPQREGALPLTGEFE